jgi:L-2,4-diaminobutyrate transaminase
MPDTLINDDLDAWDRSSFLHPTTHLAQHQRGELQGRIITGGEGSTIVDRDGRRFLDAFAALYCVNVGYGRTEIADAMDRQARELAYFHSFGGHGNEPAIRLAKMIMDRAPDHMARVFFGLSGSDANETNVKLAWQYHILRGEPQRRKVIARLRGYHGTGIVSGSMTGLPLYHANFGLPIPGFLHTEPASYLRRPDPGMSEAEYVAFLLDQLRAMIEAEGAETIAAFAGEPIMGTGGILTPPEGYWPGVQQVLNDYGILLIADEVVTGFGRLGTMFASPRFGIRPDFITVAKGLTSAYAPLSGSIVSQRIFDTLHEASDRVGVLAHGWTYSAHPVSAAAGVANLELIDSLGLVENAGRLGPVLLQGLREALSGHPNVAEIRGEGLLIAVEFMEDPGARRWFEPYFQTTYKVAGALLRRGVIARALPEADILGFAPPLCFTDAEVATVVEATREAVHEVLGPGQ